MSNNLVKLTTVACMRSPLLPRLPLAHAIKAQTLCKNKFPLKAKAKIRYRQADQECEVFEVV